MPSARGNHKVKSVKIAAPVSNGDTCSNPPKPIRRHTGWMPKPSFLGRTIPATKQASMNVEDVSVIVEPPSHALEVFQEQKRVPTVIIDRPDSQADVDCGTEPITLAATINNDPAQPVRPILNRNLSSQSIQEEDVFDGTSDDFDDLTVDETQSSASSSYTRGPSSVFSCDSASIYSSASSTYSSGASVYSSETSIYSFDEEADESSDPRLSSRPQHHQRPRVNTQRRPEIQDAAARERSTLAKKAAMFKNSRLPPTLPPFNTSLSTWSLVCRAAQASLDCYGPPTRARRGAYTAANTSKDIKAMVIDDQIIDDKRFVIVSIRGTQMQSLADWAVNKAADPTKPVSFLDDEENACHSGFLQVTKAMVGQVAEQLKLHPASSEMPSLLFTGHSAGGAVAAMLYSHMLSTSITSELIELASLFSSINCISFGAPPLSLTPMQKRDHVSGVFLAFANEGDTVLRLSNAAYLKSLAKLMTASSPSTVTVAPPVKMVRGSRGTRVIRQTIAAAPVTPWEELPLWPTPPAPLTNAGDVVLLRDGENGSVVATHVTSDDLADVIFGDLVQHTVEMYIRRVKEAAFAAMTGIDS